jgi:hypothetical protein
MSIWTWLGGIFHDVKVKLAPIIVGLLQILKGGESSGILPLLANALSPITKGLSVAANALLMTNINNQLALWLGIEQLPASPTLAQEEAFGLLVLTAIEGKKATQTVAGQVNVDLAAILYNTIANTVGADKIANLKVTAGQIAIDVEQSYQQWVASEAAAGTPVATSVVPPAVPTTPAT